MKIVYIADNRCRPNFGCRGTSIALSQLLAKEHEIVGTVSGEYTLSGDIGVFYIPGLPRWAYVLCSKLPGWKSLIKRWKKVFRSNRGLGRIFDFVSVDPEKSIKKLCRCLPANPHLREFDLRRHNFDGVVVNGEGTFIMSTPPRRDTLVYMMFLVWAKQLGKKVYLVNAIYSDCPSSASNIEVKSILGGVLSSCDFVSARDPESLRLLKKDFPELDVEYIPDALFTWLDRVMALSPITRLEESLPFGQEEDKDFERFDFSKPYICVSGGSVAAKNRRRAKVCYQNLVKALRNEVSLPIYLIEVCRGDRFLREVGRELNIPCLQVEVPILTGAKILSQASLYISGRFHPSIMASLGGAPCIFLGSNSHKTWSIQEMLEYGQIKEFPAFPSEGDVDEIVELCRESLHVEAERRPAIQEVAQRRSGEAMRLLGYIK